MNRPEWLIKAETYLGTTEYKGIRHHPLIVGWWKLIKRSGIKDDETPWCAAFVGGVLEESGVISSRFEGASSYLKWGYGIKQPCLGCIAVVKRVGGYHVFFVDGRTSDGMVVGIGGNQSDAVTRAVFDPNRVLAYRWPYGVEEGARPIPVVDLKNIKKSVKED